MSFAPTWTYSREYQQWLREQLRQELAFAEEDMIKAEEDKRAAWRELHKAAQRRTRAYERLARLRAQMQREEA